MAGRTVAKWARVYVDGYDVSGNSRTIGDLKTAFEEVDSTAMSDTVKGYLPGICALGVGTLNGIFDNTATTGLHTLVNGAGVRRLVTVAIGDRAVPAQGVPAFSANAYQVGYQGQNDGGAVVASVPFSDGIAPDGAGGLLYPLGWGVLLNASTTARTAANASTGVDGGGATTFGGYMTYHVLAANGTATISVDDSADNAAWAAVSGMTTGSITMAAGTSGAVAIGRSATIRRYTRWQLALGTATSVTFVIVLHRATF